MTTQNLATVIGLLPDSDRQIDERMEKLGTLRDEPHEGSKAAITGVGHSRQESAPLIVKAACEDDTKESDASLA